MGANVSVIGVNNGMGGLKESMAKFRTHHREVGDALMNISGVGTGTGDSVDKDEPRPAYVHQDWPKMAFHADGREEIAVTPADFQALLDRGFRATPYLKPRVAVLDPATEKKALMDTNAQLQAQLTRQGELMEQTYARLQALEVPAEPKKGK